ncbi:MAG: SIR2 family protein [Deltaproteobacteria bacterium]|nr:SIR2 family protein [Deltaproteobacteria bacterium]
MQFIQNGPDISDVLLQAHEEGKVVFFCGAGISYPAGLPGFKGLVNEIYREIETSFEPIEEEAYKRDQYDATLDLLERRVPGQRVKVRRALSKVLQPNLRKKGAIETHTSLLQLARNRECALRLVTTNFDRIFEHAAKKSKYFVNAYSAPMLPIPKMSRWDGLVYLHGALPPNNDYNALNRLVLTSGDFGLAYLTERWAARFVSELFRNYVVCFVGYSINDPVLRYMMDALAADRMLGEETPRAYAFGEYETGQDKEKKIEWEAKGVIPILYEIPRGTHDHSSLHKSLKGWAETYRDGILGKERIVVNYALANPSESTRQDDFVGRMLWALSDESGLPAKHFADFNPVPSLTWLSTFSEYRFKHEDLCRFGIVPNTKPDTSLGFSLLDHPTPYTLAPNMSLVSREFQSSKFDKVMSSLSDWLMRHMNNPDLIIWLAEKGGRLHPHLHWVIERQLEKYHRLEQEGKISELAEIRLNAPDAIPSPNMYILWRIFLSGQIKSQLKELSLYHWYDWFKRDGLTAALRFELRKILSPKVILRKPFRLSERGERLIEPKTLNEMVDWEIVLASDHVYSALGDNNSDLWNETLSCLLEDLQQLLRDALDLFHDLGEANEKGDRSHWDLPSISPHWQNRGFHDWTALVELVRDAWLATFKQNPEKAKQIVLNWFNMPYPTFKRLALFGASQDDCISPKQWVKWLLSEKRWWLWASETKRETMRLLVSQGAKLTKGDGNKLESAILTGPPREMYRDDIDPENWKYIVDKSIWLHLAKIKEGGRILGKVASIEFARLSKKYPKWKLNKNESEEFSHWMSSSDDPDYEENREIDIAPKNRKALVKWLKKPMPENRFPFGYEDTWRETCTTYFYNCLYALCDLAQEKIWPLERWRVAFQAWSKEDMVVRSWKFAAPLVTTLPDEIFKELIHSISWWLEAASKSYNHHETIFFTLCNRILAMQYDDSETDDPLSKALNHPIGHTTRVLLNILFKLKPSDNETLPKDIKTIFTKICDTKIKQLQHGRVLLASRLISLFRIDRNWTEQYLLPLFDWNIDKFEAKAVWEGFLWSPRIYQPLLLAFKPQFLDTARYYKELGEHNSQYAAFLTYVSLNNIDGYSNKDFQNALKALPPEGLQETAQALAQALESSGEQRESYYKNRIQPFWRNIWPKSRNLASNAISVSLARLSIAARNEFPSALSAVYDWLLPIEYPDYTVHMLEKSGIPKKFPNDSLRLLNAIIDNQIWAPTKLGECLKAIVEVAPELEQDHRYQKLIIYLRQH